MWLSINTEIIEVLEVPERPEGPLEIFDVAETRATLQWYPPRDAGGGPIIGYIIDARELDKIDIISHLELVPPTCTSAIMEGLEPGRLYQFRVYSENAAGMSEALIGPRCVRIQPGIARPSCPGVPTVVPRQGGDAFQQLAYSNKPDDAVIIQWAAPYTDGGTPVNGYAVERKAGPNGQWVRAHPLDVRESEVTLTGLIPGQDYKFRVKAVNAIGWSEPGSESESYRVPYDPNNVVSPSFSVGLRDAVVMEHEKVEFRVEVQGIPPPDVQWIVNASSDAKVIVTERDPDSGVSTLVVNDVLAGDEGEVKCVAVNDAGQSTSSAILTVEAPPRAVLTKKYEDGLIFEDGDIIRLKVEFTGRPKPAVTWYHENQLLTSGGRLEIENLADCTILKVAEAKRSDRGEYSVKLQSGLGEDSASFLVTVANRPSMPGKPLTADVSESVVSLHWDPSEDDGGCEITCYIVEYNRLGWDMWLKATTSKQPHIRLGDLIPGSTYVFRVKAENPFGVSEPSAQSDLVCLPARSNETSWVPDVTSSELVDPDDTTISSSNLGPRDSDRQVSRSGDLDYLPLDASELELSRLTDPSVLGAPNGAMGGAVLMSEPPNRPGEIELDPRYAFSASAVLEKRAVTLSSQPGFTSNDVLSGIGSSTSRNSSSSPSVSPERPSLEDALSLDDDSSEGSSHDIVKQPTETVEQLPLPIQQRGFLLPRSPARLFVHNAIVQSALSSVASSSALVTLSDVMEQVVVEDQVLAPDAESETRQEVLEQIEQDLQDQLEVLDRIELDIGEKQEADVDGNEVEFIAQADQSSVQLEQSDAEPARLDEETVIEEIKRQDQFDLMNPNSQPSDEMTRVKPSEPDEIELALADQQMEVPTILLQDNNDIQHQQDVIPAMQSHLAAIDSGVCELMAQRGSDGEGQHSTDQYSDAYMTAVDSMSSCDFGDSPEPDGLVLDRPLRGECPSPTTSVKRTMDMDDEADLVPDASAFMGSDGKPIFLRCVTDQTVKVGSRARFLAEIISSSGLVVTWHFNGLPVFQPGETAHGRFKILQEGNFYCLEISPVAIEDEGAWTCRASLADNAGSEEGVSATAQLRVMVPKSYKRPEFVEDLQAILTEEGTVSLECKVVGIPTPVLHWFKDGKEIKAGDVFAFRAPQTDSTAEETATSLGIYSCEAINCIGKAISTSQVRVRNAVQQQPPTPSRTNSQSESTGPPVIIEEPFNQKVRVGEDVRFTVRVMVPPLPSQVKWYNKDVPKEASSKYVVGEDGHGGYSLDITPTDIDDDGEWKVAIKNEGVDAESNASAVLTLVVPKNYRPPRFLESLKAILTEEGLVSFECKVVGFPTPQLQWFKDGQELKPGDVYQLSGTNSLGSYSCVARNCMGQAVSAAELTVDDIQNQLNDEERRQLMDSHRPPIFTQGLRSSESRVGDPLRLTVQVSSTTESFLVTWFHNDEPIDLDETHKFRSLKEEAGLCHLDVEPLEFSDEGDWKCIVINDFGHAVTSCSVKLSVPRFFRKPHFLEPLRAVLSDEGTVNLECKVIGVPQPSLKWYKDGVELKPGDIHRIMSGQDGTCCLGTYTCEAHNCMGTSSSSAALLGFEDRLETEQNVSLAKEETLLDTEPRSYMTEHPRIARNPSLSTIQEERSSQISLYETANAEDTLTGEERAEISVSLDGREVSVSLYETPDLTEEEAQQIVELFAEELSERISYKNTTELPPLRFTRETATSGSLLMEAVVIDVPMEINGNSSYERTLSDLSFEEAPTEADIEELSAMEALIIEEADMRNDPYFLDDLTIPDLPYEVNDVRQSITGLQEAFLIQEASPTEEERQLHLESHSGGATPVVMSPRRLSIERDAAKVEEDFQAMLADGIQSPVDVDYYSPLEYSDSCSVPSSSPQPDWLVEEPIAVATPVAAQQPEIIERPVEKTATPTDAVEPLPAEVATVDPALAPQVLESALVSERIQNLMMSNKSSLDIRESASETETSADENSQRLMSDYLGLGRTDSLSSAKSELQKASEISQAETSQSSSTLIQSKLSTIRLGSDQTITSGADTPESGDQSGLLIEGIQVTRREDVICAQESWNEASHLAKTMDTLMDEPPVEDHSDGLKEYPSTSPTRNLASELGIGQEEKTSDFVSEETRAMVASISSSDATRRLQTEKDAEQEKHLTQISTEASQATETTTEESKATSIDFADDIKPIENISGDRDKAERRKTEGEEKKSFQKEADEAEQKKKEADEAEQKKKEGEENDGLLEASEEKQGLQKESEEKDRLQKEAEEKDQFLREEVNRQRLQEEAEGKDRIQKEAEENERLLRESEEKQHLKMEAEKDRLQKETEEKDRLLKEAEEKDGPLKEEEEKQRIQKESEVKDRLQKEAEEKDRLLKEEEEKQRIQKESEEKDRLQKEAEEKDRLLKEEEEKQRIQKELEEKDRLQKEAEEKDRLLKEEEEKQRIQKESEEKDRLHKEAEEKDRLLKEEEEKQRIQKESEEKNRLQKEAEEKDRLMKEEEEKQSIQKELEEKDRLQKEAEEKDRLLKEEEEKQRIQKESEEKDRLQKEAEEKDRLLKEEEEKQRIQKETEEKNRLQKEAKEKDRLLKQEEEKQIIQKELEEKDRLQKEAEEKDRLLKEEEEKQRIQKESEEKDRLQKEAEEKDRLLKEEEEKKRIQKESEEKYRLQKEAEEKDRLLKEEEEKQCIQKELEEKDRLQKEAEEKDRLLKEEEEKQRIQKESEEKDRLQKEAEENDRLLKEEEEKQRIQKETEEKDRLQKELEEKERIQKEAQEKDLLLKEAEEKQLFQAKTDETEETKKDIEAEEKDFIQNETQKEVDVTERLLKEEEIVLLPKESKENESKQDLQKKEVEGSQIKNEDKSRINEVEERAVSDKQLDSCNTRLSDRPNKLPSGAGVTELMELEKHSVGLLRNVDRSRLEKVEFESSNSAEKEVVGQLGFKERSKPSTERPLTEDELIEKQIEEEKRNRRREAAERLLREQEQKWASEQSGNEGVKEHRHDEKIRLEQAEMQQAVDEHIRKHKQEEEIIQREADEERVQQQRQKEEERRIRLEEAEKIRKEVEIQERLRREEKERKQLEAERIRREEEAEEWALKEKERIRLEEEIQRLESERIRMKEERRLRQAKEEEEERLRLKKEREERLRREQEEEERLRQEEEEQLKLMKEERERNRKLKEEEEERMLREIEERSQKKKDENERIRKEKEEEERKKKEEEKLRREEEEKKRMEEAEKLRKETEEKSKEKEEKRMKQEEEKRKRDEEEKKIKDELKRQKEEETRKILEELETNRNKRALEEPIQPEDERIEAEVSLDKNKKDLTENVKLDKAQKKDDEELNLSDKNIRQKGDEKTTMNQREENIEEQNLKGDDDKIVKQTKGNNEAVDSLIKSKEQQQEVVEENQLKGQHKETEHEKQKDQQEKEPKRAEVKNLKETEQAIKETEDKKLKEQQEKERKEAEEKKLKEQQEKERIEAEAKKIKEQQEKERKEAEERKLKEQQEKERKEAEEKKLKEKQEKERKEAEDKKLKEQQEKERKEAEDKKLKELQEKERKEAEDKKLKEQQEKVRKEAEDKKLKEQQEKERKEAEDKKLKEQQEKERKEAEEKKLKEQQEKERKEAEAQKLKNQKEEKERKETEEKNRRDQQEKERKEAEEKKLKEQKEKERKEAEAKEENERIEAEKKKKKQDKERKEVEEAKIEQKERERKERKKKEKQEKERKEAEERSIKDEKDNDLKKGEEKKLKTAREKVGTGAEEKSIQEHQEQKYVKVEEKDMKRRSEYEERQGDDAHPRSGDESPTPNKDRRRRTVLQSDEESTAENSSDYSTRRRTRVCPPEESRYDTGIHTGIRRRPVPTVMEETDSLSPLSSGFDSSHRQPTSGDFDVRSRARLIREDMRHGIRSCSAGVVLSSMRSRTSQMEWDSSSRSHEDNRRDPSKKPKFSSKLRDMEVAKGSRVKLSCSLLCSPEPEIEWFRNGLSILKNVDSHKYVINWNPIGIASLEIRDLCRSDTGEYMCVARNHHGQASTSADLRVRGDYEPKTSSPSFTSAIRDVYYDTTDELVLESIVNGFPTPKITWMKDGIKLHLSSRYKQSVDLDGRCRLVVHSPCAGDSGQYTCVAQNASRKDEISTYVVVPEHVWDTEKRAMKTLPSHAGYSGGGEFHRRTAADKLASSGDTHSFDGGRYDGIGAQDDSAHFVQLPESTVTVGRDRDLVIQCRVRGHPRPKVTWLKGIRDVVESGRSCVEMDGDSYRFILKKANYGDGGTYIVKASNCHGSQKAYCTVRVKETANSSDWDFKDSPAMQQPADLAECRVRRFNKDVPGPVPAPPTATVSGKNVVSLSWAKPNYIGGAPILAYKVEAWLLGEGAIWIEVATTVITSSDVYNLKPDREYLFRITPKNKYGWGESLVSSTPIRTVSKTGLPHFHRQLHPQIKAMEHTDIELLTEVTGEPTPQVEWYRDGSKVDGVKNPRYELRSIRADCRHALTIHDVQMETDDDSKFSCEAVNPAGRVATFSRVLVVTDERVAEADAQFRQQLDCLSCGNDKTPMAPQFTMRPRDRRVQVAFPVRLTCQVIGFPKPDVTWYHNHNPIIIGDDDRHSYSVDGNFYTLEIATTKFDDAGVYSVQGRNSSGAVGCQCCLVVDGGIRAYVMPFFTHELEERNVSEGGTVSLIARVEAYPAVGVLWHRDGIRLRPCRQYDMRLESDGSVALVVSGVLARRHAGVYTCTVTNEMGQVSSSARVTVKPQRPSASSSADGAGVATDHDAIALGETTSSPAMAPKFVRKPRSTEVVEGDSLVVVCEVIGDPKPEVIWLRDWLNPDYYDDADHFVREGDGPVYKLTIPCVKLDFTGAYSVIARNVHGEAKAVISLQVYVHGQGRQGRQQETAGSSTGHSTTLGGVLTAPKVVQPLRHLRCCDGDTVTFECRFNGQPEAAGTLQVHWQRGGKLLRLCKDFSTEVNANEGVARLSIGRVYPEDEGEYTCVAYNELGSDSTSACLIVDVADDKENDLMVQLDSRPAGTVSARATPRTTPSRTIRSLSPINSKTATQQQQQQQQQQTKSGRVRKVPPKFYSVPHNKIAETGETVRFQCNVGGNPSPRVTWDRDNIAIKPESITPAGRVRIEERDDVRVLEIRNVTSEDAGLYRITVENELGRIQANARLDILSRSSGSRSAGFIRSGSAATAGRGTYYSALSGSSASRLAGRTLGLSGASYLRGTSTPRSGGRYHATSDMDGSGASDAAAAATDRPVSFVTKLPSRMRVNEGDAVELQVLLTGTPPLKVVWVHNDSPLVDCPEFRHLDYGDGRYALRLADPFTHDSGVYFCEAYNLYGDAESWCRLIVTDPADKHFNETSAEASVTLAYSSANTASIRTRNDDETEEEEEENKTGEEEDFSCSKEDLTYESDKLNDELDNPFQVAAQIVKGPVSVSTLIGSTVLLEALIIGRPEPTVRWLKGGKELVESDRVEMRQADGMASLSLHGITADDSGKYIVMAENTFGMDCHYASLAVEGPPDPGGKPTICEVKADSLTLTWYGSVYDGGSVITGYLVEICETGQSWRVLTSECNSTSYVIHGLAPLRTYQFRVRAKNIHGSSEPSCPSDPLFYQPPLVAERRDKAVVVDHHHHREEKDLHRQVSSRDGRPEDELDYDQDNDDSDESQAPQFEHCHVTVQPGEPHFLEKYSVHEELGKGRFGVVYRLVDRASGALRAAKYVRCIKAADREKVYQEVAIMNKLQHPKLLQLAAAYDCPKEIVLVTEYISGGELFERVVADDFTLTERDCILFMRQICQGVGYMHSKSIVHLDLKPENILCQSPNSHRIKLIDFGLARQLDPDTPVRVLFGTPEFIAPEIVSYEPIGCATDMWSLGVVCYVLLSGLSPFMGDNDADTFANITSSDYDFDDDAFAAISSDAKDFISSLLVKRPELRLSAETCLQHKWLAQAKQTMNSVKLPTDRLKKFIIRRKWQVEPPWRRRAAAVAASALLRARA
ncbi:titin homolog isoform X7 [Daphnia pulicaria]|uniref:titin homolog isoform X7 n=1 Tax=Daphnia pulicaria TaxID=35523 RepID=UPI001EEC5624|nr:titin homolog isoform X7 [Daphnia pulicaria]